MKQESKPSPPKAALRLLSWFCPNELYEEIEGDLIYRFNNDANHLGPQQAKSRLIWNVLRFFRPGILLRNKMTLHFYSRSMIKNYFVTAFRYLLKHKSYAAINVVGLAAGLSVCFFAFLYVQFEYSYDTFHTKADRIYRVVTDVHTANGIMYESSHGPLAAAIRETCPEAEAVTHLFLDYLLVQKDKAMYGEEKVAYADSTLFDVFTLPLVRGNRQKVLDAANNLVLSETTAKKYFGDADPVGQAMMINGTTLAYVTGVMNDIPQNSHFRVDILVSKATLGESWMSNWKRFFFYTYVLLPEKTDPAIVEAKLPSIVHQHLDQKETKYKLSMEPLKSIYLYGKARGSRAGSSVAGNRTNLYVFGVIALFVLVIAGFNFINLTTAFSMQRAKEVSVRKVLGSVRTQLVVQFLVDALLISSIAFVLALLISVVLLPFFNELAGKVITVSVFEHIDYLFLLLAVALSIGLLSGVYPALFLSGFQPLRGLKGRFVTGTQGSVLRKGLVIAQFSISILLIVATIVVYSQLHFMQTQELGFKKAHSIVVDFQFDERIINREEAVRQQLLTVPQVEQVSLSSSIPGKANHQFPVKIENALGDIQEFQSDTYYVDYDFLSHYEVQVAAGRSFSRQFASDSTEAMIINEAAAHSLGFTDPQEAIGKNFQQLARRGTIVGVIADFHFHSVKEKVRPLTLLVGKTFMTFLTIEVSSANPAETIQQLEAKWQQLVPGLPFLYFYADDAYDAQYISEARFGKLFICFAVLAILISCLGLIGLSAFSIAQRTKEIGVRKVLGSSTTRIVHLLTKEFFILMAIAFAIAVPLAWMGMNSWLQSFAYQINIAWWMFALAGMIVVTVAFATISFQTIRAAMTNPVKSLKTE
ncbi:MAG: cell division protein FtsX [Azospira oryzae]|nr:MAG: cell division protein FtsX [Azospira oryzae]